MHINWIPTDQYYRELIATTDPQARRALYEERFIQPWAQMMSMFAGQFGAGEDDPLAGARAWNWLLPDHLQTAPESLQKLEAANAWAKGGEAMALAAEHFSPYADRIPFDQITGWLMLANPETSDPAQQGYTGATDWMQPRFVVQYDTVTGDNLAKLRGAIVHEMQHLVRFRSSQPFNPMTSTVADYIVAEGTAESFAAALFGPDVVGHYVTNFNDNELETARDLIGANLHVTGFDTLRAFIFGDHWAQKYGLQAVGMPLYGGYAIGYRVVQAFLQRTGTSIEQATFMPADEIVAASGYFA